MIGVQWILGLIILFVCAKAGDADICSGSCCWLGPSVEVIGGGRATGVGWPEKFPTVEKCAKRCEEVADCKAFHYYGAKDTHASNAYTDCYLHKKGTLGTYLADGRDRYAGICTPDICSGSCCWRGPSVTVTGGGQATGVGWPEKFPTVEKCAKRCEEVADCKAFHYYGAKDTHASNAYTDCYLHKVGTLSSYLADERDRYAGICREAQYLIQYG
eukprot:GFUD01133053.1.p1 GENE.GFUD01133053.1~~GFUD01133053.1.p1  ORF type:complete len:215 (+),score=35.77 GFUD01133053.1:40-684(+)